MSQKENRRFLWFFISTSLFWGGATSFTMFTLQLLSVSGLSMSTVGTIHASSFFIISYLFKNIAKFPNLKVARAITICLLFVSFFLLIIGFCSSLYLIIPFYYILMCTTHIFPTFTKKYINDSVATSIQASALSVNSVFTYIVIGSAIPLVGYLIEKLDIHRAISLSALFPIAGVILFLVYRRFYIVQ